MEENHEMEEKKIMNAEEMAKATMADKVGVIVFRPSLDCSTPGEEEGGRGAKEEEDREEERRFL